ncbi:serine hydrolase FSH [Chaetomidium leptoderma]|uniref:Serine hydrolase FSH n=1 Tax=Chaetomidium leptoderma TaxID=669021 RepID=A0AAN6ZTE8_9PEZI|nr:serine hydrolase FSH [Chaetomidium leptoderma]
MRFLCLHGMGTNSAIYEAQLSPIRAHLGPEHEFVFVDGILESEPADSVAGIFPPPFVCYYSKPTQDQLEAAYDLVEEVMDEEGPFDGVFGFSQGGALIASILLQRRKTHPTAPDLFRVAVFTCASLPFDLDSNRDNLGRDKYHTVIDPRTGAVSVRDFVAGIDHVEATKFNGYMAAPEPGELPLRRYHPGREPRRIQIPTIHIIGERDPFAPQSSALVGLCEDAVVVTHERGHELSRDRLFAKKAAQAISAAVSRALFRC